MPGKTRVPIPAVLAVGAVTVVALAAAFLPSGSGSDGGTVSVAARGTAPAPAPQNKERPATPTPSPTFVTGTRQGESVSVERHRFEADDAEELFSYEEIQPYPPTQPAEPNRPDLAVSPDGDRVAYSDGSSIRIHDLRSGATRIVVSGTGQGEHLPLRWSIPAMNTDPATDGVWGIWAVGEPSWSPDGRHLAFHQGWWEGSDYGVIDLATGAYHATPGGSDFEWVGDGAAAVAGSFYTEPGRVHVSRSNASAGYRDVTERLPGPPGRHYDDVAVSPDARSLAVSWAEDAMGPPTCCAAIMRADGSDFRPLPVTGNVQSMAFTADGSGLYLVERQEGRTVVVLHRTGGAPRTLRTLPGDLYRWDVRVRPDGRLGLLGRTALPYEGTDPMLCEQDCPPFRSRLLLADPDTAATLHESGDFDRDTAVDGFPASIW